jgi:hypothetical protein
MRNLFLFLALGALAGGTTDQQQRFADGYCGEPGHTFAQAIGDTIAAPINAAGQYATGYSNAYRDYNVGVRAGRGGRFLLVNDALDIKA